MNQIKNIEIKNFKSIRHQKIEDCRRINVFVGYPNTGKSNILEAIGLYGSVRQPGEDFKFTDICRVNKFSELFFNKDYRNATSVVINDNLLLELLINPVNDLEIRIGTRSGKEKKDYVALYAATVANAGYEYRINNQVSESTISAFAGPIRKYVFKNDGVINQRQPYSLSVPLGANLLEILHRDSSLRKEIAALFEEYGLKLVIDDEEIIFLKYLSDDTGISIPYNLVADTLRRLIFYKAAIWSNKVLSYYWKSRKLICFRLIFPSSQQM